MKPIQKGKAVAIAAGLIVAGVVFLGALSWREFAARYYAWRVGSKDERDFRAAISALQNLGPPGLPGLLLALRDDRPEVCQLAAESIGRIRPFEAITITKLIGMLNDGKALTRRAATFALNKMGAEGRAAIPKLIEAFSDPDPMVRCQAVNAMRHLDLGVFSSFPELVKILKDENPEVRLEVARVLAVFAGQGKEIGEAIPSLIENLDDPNAHVRGASGKAIAAAGQSARSAIPTLKTMVKGSNKLLAGQALGILGAIALNENMGMFMDAIKDADPEVSGAAVRILSTVSGKSVLEALLGAFKSGSAQFRMEILGCLRGSPHAIPIFMEALKDSDPEMRIKVADSLGDLGPAAKAAIPALKSLEGDLSDDVKNSVKVALEEIGKVAREPDRGK
jgi:HEAT repeat protein